MDQKVRLSTPLISLLVIVRLGSLFANWKLNKLNGVVAKGLSFSLKFMIVRALESQTWAGCLARAYSEAT